MTKQTIEEFVVQFFMDNKQALDGVAKLQNAFVKLKKAAGVAVLAGFATKIAQEVKQFVDEANAVGQLSDSINANAEDIQAWGEAVKRQNGSVEAFNGTLQTMSRELNMIPLQGASSQLAQQLTRLGVSFYGLNGNIKKPIQLLKELSLRFEGLSKVQSFAIGQKLGLDEGTIRLLQRGRKGVDELIDKVKSIGVYTKKDIEQAQKLKQVYYDWQQSITALGIRLTRYFLPIAEKLSQWFQMFTTWSSRNERKLKAFFVTLATVITVSLLPALASAATALAGFIANPYVAGIAAIGSALYLLYEDYMAWAEGAPSAFNWQPFLDGVTKAKEIASDFVDFMKVGFDGLMNIINKVSEILNKFINSDTGKYLKKIGEKWLDFKKKELSYILEGKLGDDIFYAKEKMKNILGRIGILKNETTPIPNSYLNHQNNSTVNSNNRNISIDKLNITTNQPITRDNLYNMVGNEMNKYGIFYQGNFGMEGGSF